jgi:exosortase family protein XrtF
MRAYKTLLFFLTKALLLYVTWNILYDEWIRPHTAVEEKMTVSLASLTGNLLSVWGFSADVRNAYSNKGGFAYAEVLVDNAPGILIGNPCNGLSLIILFAGFIIAYPGSWKVKTGYILVGSLLIYAINLIRIQILVFNFLYSEQSFDFNHKYTYTMAVYLCIFMLWLLWANRFSNRRSLTVSRVA